QTEALKEENVQVENLRGMERDFEIRTDGSRCIKNQSWLPLFGNLRDMIMHESHKSKYSIHPGFDKMYHDLKKLYWWPNMKAIIVEYVDPYSAATHSGGVTDWHQEPRTRATTISYLCVGPEHPPSPDYVPGPEHPPLPIKIPYVSEPEYPEYLAPSDDEAPLEDQPLHADASPIALSLEYVADSDPKRTQRKTLRRTILTILLMEGMDDDDEEEEHLALTDSFDVPIVDPIPPARDSKAFETDEKTVRLEPPMSASMEVGIARHAVALTPSLHVPSLPLPLPSPLTTGPTDARAPLGYKAAEIKMRALLPSTSHRTDILEADIPPRKRAFLTTPALRFEVGESSTAGAARKPGPAIESDRRRYKVEQTGYGTTDTWDEIVDTLMEIAPTTLEGLDQRVIDLDTTIRAWASSEDKSAAIEAHVQTLEAHVATLIAQTSSLQTQLTRSFGRIETLKARDLEPQDEPAEAGSSC
nr:putative reverse transcriptase domain-containing protein [Tanacetum cinerariifolium]